MSNTGRDIPTKLQDYPDKNQDRTLTPIDQEMMERAELN